MKFQRIHALFFIIIVVALVAVVFVIYYFMNSNNVLSTNNNNQQNSSKAVQLTGGLEYEDLKIGDGQEIKKGDKIQIHYIGTLENGTKFDSSVDRGQKFETTIGVGQVIRGWDEGIPGMKEGGERRLKIPADLAYGNRAIGGIPAGSTLIFVVRDPKIVKEQPVSYTPRPSTSFAG